MLYHLVMEDTLNKVTSMEEKITLSINLLEIAKAYCEFNREKSDEISSLFSILEIILVEQKKLISDVENLLVG